MSDLNEILNALYKADLVLEVVDPDDQNDDSEDGAAVPISDYPFPEELRPLPTDSLETLFWKRVMRFFYLPHVSTSYVLGAGVNLNDFLPPGIEMTYESVTQFNQIVTSFPPYWWTGIQHEWSGTEWVPTGQSIHPDTYDMYWSIFLSSLIIYGIEYDMDEFTDINEWALSLIRAAVGADALFDDILGRMSNLFMETFGWSIIQASAYVNGLWDGVTEWTEKAIAQAAGWTVQQAVAFMNGAWNGITDWGRWIETLTNTLPIPMLPNYKLMGEQTSSMDRMKEKHRDENDRIKRKHEREIDAAQRRERNRRRTQRQG